MNNTFIKVSVILTLVALSFYIISLVAVFLYSNLGYILAGIFGYYMHAIHTVVKIKSLQK
jgi:uncharacterized membrane protein